MKELSIEEKAHRYDEAIEKGKQIQNTPYTAHWDTMKEVVEHLLPELAESEDERIKKEIINYFECQSRDEPTRKDIHNEWINWLEKQGEQNTVNKVEPKFKVGDWVVNNDDGCVCQITSIREDDYCLWPFDSDVEGYLKITDIDNKYHLWTIKDAKDGDVLVTKSTEQPFIFKGLLDKFHPKSPVAYCGIGLANTFMIPTGVSWWTGEEVEPATKEQRDLLFSKIKDAGYEWDTDKKELKKIDNDNVDKGEKPAWSEEDNVNLEKAIWYVENPAPMVVKDSMLVEWLKSLKQRVGE